MKTSFKEIRLHKDKPPQSFSCELLHREDDYVVLHYTVPTRTAVKDIPIEKGSTTIAHYWKNRNYILWKFKDPNHLLTGYLFHICNKIEIGATYVRYEDLELDLWFDPCGKVTVLDQDEADDCFRRGLITAEERSLIERQKNIILSTFKNIVTGIWTEGPSS